MTAIGKVTQIKDKNTAIVVSQRMSACASCDKCESKGACEAQLVFGNSNSEVVLQAKNVIGAGVGDTVELSSSSKKMLFAAFGVFVLPVITALIGYFVCNAITSSMVASGVTLMLLFALSFVLAAVYMNGYAKRNISIEIINIVKESTENSGALGDI